MDDDVIQFAKSVGYEYHIQPEYSAIDKCYYEFIKDENSIIIQRHYAYYPNKYCHIIEIEDHRYHCYNKKFLSEIVKLILLTGKWDDDLVSSIMSVDLLTTNEDCRVIGNNRGLDNMNKAGCKSQKWYIWPGNEWQ